MKKVLIFDYDGVIINSLPVVLEILVKVGPKYGLKNVKTKEDLQDILVNEVNKFNNAITESAKKLGFMYFIIGLGGVCQDCLTSHPWLMYI